eukprot:scaffold1070_cov245-Pinguiococcus_pyrenoidosus.AAC.5
MSCSRSALRSTHLRKSYRPQSLTRRSHPARAEEPQWTRGAAVVERGVAACDGILARIALDGAIVVDVEDDQRHGGLGNHASAEIACHGGLVLNDRIPVVQLAGQVEERDGDVPRVAVVRSGEGEGSRQDGGNRVVAARRAHDDVRRGWLVQAEGVGDRLSFIHVQERLLDQNRDARVVEDKHGHVPPRIVLRIFQSGVHRVTARRRVVNHDLGGTIESRVHDRIHAEVLSCRPVCRAEVEGRRRNRNLFTSISDHRSGDRDNVAWLRSKLGVVHGLLHAFYEADLALRQQQSRIKNAVAVKVGCRVDLVTVCVHCGDLRERAILSH